MHERKAHPSDHGLQTLGRAGDDKSDNSNGGPEDEKIPAAKEVGQSTIQGEGDRLSQNHHKHDPNDGVAGACPRVSPTRLVRVKDWTVWRDKDPRGAHRRPWL